MLQALPPAEMTVFAGAKMFYICNLANQAAVMTTVSANSMQQLLCAQDTQVKQWKAKVIELRLGKSRVDQLIGEALRREQNMNRELDTLREQAGRVLEYEGQLVEAGIEIEQLRAQGSELEEERKQVAGMEALKTRLTQKEKEMEETSEKNLSLTQDLAASVGKLAWSEETRRFLMTMGIGEIVAKCRASHEFGKLVGWLTSDIQAMGKTDLVREL